MVLPDTVSAFGAPFAALPKVLRFSGEVVEIVSDSCAGARLSGARRARP